MKAKDILAHFKEVGTWVDWDNTCDEFLHGDPEAEVTGIATAWIPTNAAIREVAAKGHSLFVVHEPSFVHCHSHTPSGKAAIAAKRRLLDECGITLLRCHDTWDRMPEVGIPDAWATHLGFETEPRPVESYYKICLLGDVTVEGAARMVLAKVRSLGQEAVLIFGDRTKTVSRMGVGTGAITHVSTMHELGADVILATDDGMNFWEGGLWSADLDVPVLIVNHATSEKPGMMAMAPHLAGLFGVPVEYVDVAYPYSVVV